MKHLLKPSHQSRAYHLNFAIALCCGGLVTGAALLAVESRLTFTEAAILRFTSVPAYFVSILLGAFGTGWVIAGAFGRSGGAGVIVSLLSGTVATVTSALLAGALIVPWDIGLALVALVYIAVLPPLPLIWLALMIGLHFYAAHLRIAVPSREGC